jgi:5-methylcytosine-specific restriction endonuclease McrA
MRRLTIPTEKVAEIFTRCISIVQDKSLKASLEGCLADLNTAESDYESKVRSINLHKINRISSLNGVSGKELVKVYTGRMVPKGKPGRSFYEKLINSPKHGKCPLCGHRIVSTLDHHLSKAHYPQFSVTPVNLIPACKDCNTSKSTDFPSNPEEETIHPYFDNIEDERWLFAEVVQTTPASIRFTFNKPDSWTDLLFKRVINHFNSLELSILYSSQCAEEIVNIHLTLANLHSTGGVNSVKEFLSDAAMSRFKNQKNSWQTALYYALVESTWFCNGGFKLE